MKYNDIFFQFLIPHNKKHLTKREYIKKIIHIELLILFLLIIVTYVVKSTADNFNRDIVTISKNIENYNNQVHLLEAEWSLAISPENINKMIENNNLSFSSSKSVNIKGVEYLENSNRNFADIKLDQESNNNTN